MHTLLARSDSLHNIISCLRNCQQKDEVRQVDNSLLKDEQVQVAARTHLSSVLTGKVTPKQFY